MKRLILFVAAGFLLGLLVQNALLTPAVCSPRRQRCQGRKRRSLTRDLGWSIRMGARLGGWSSTVRVCRCLSSRTGTNTHNLLADVKFSFQLTFAPRVPLGTSIGNGSGDLAVSKVSSTMRAESIATVLFANKQETISSIADGKPRNNALETMLESNSGMIGYGEQRFIARAE